MELDHINKITEMMKMQKELNDFTNGAEWYTGKTVKGKPINWFRAIHLEAAEAIDSFDWKWWKDISTGIAVDNLEIEMIDIFHFILSAQLQSAIVYDKDIDYEYTVNYWWNNNLDFTPDNTRIPPEEVMKLLEGLIKEAIDRDLDSITESFIVICNTIGLPLSRIYNTYVIKNTLNIFRQTHGYADGTYQKMWNGREDNEHLIEIASTIETISKEGLLEKLEERYQSLKD